MLIQSKADLYLTGTDVWMDVPKKDKMYVLTPNGAAIYDRDPRRVEQIKMIGHLVGMELFDQFFFLGIREITYGNDIAINVVTKLVHIIPRATLISPLDIRSYWYAGFNLPIEMIAPRVFEKHRKMLGPYIREDGTFTLDEDLWTLMKLSL